MRGKLTTFLYGKKGEQKKNRKSVTRACPREKPGQVRVVERTINIYICTFFFLFFYCDTVYNTCVRNTAKIRWAKRNLNLLSIGVFRTFDHNTIMVKNTAYNIRYIFYNGFGFMTTFTVF